MSQVRIFVLLLNTKDSQMQILVRLLRSVPITRFPVNLLMKKCQNGVHILMLIRNFLT